SVVHFDTVTTGLARGRLTGIRAFTWASAAPTVGIGARPIKIEASIISFVETHAVRGICFVISTDAFARDALAWHAAPCGFEFATNAEPIASAFHQLERRKRRKTLAFGITSPNLCSLLRIVKVDALTRHGRRLEKYVEDLVTIVRLGSLFAGRIDALRDRGRSGKARDIRRTLEEIAEEPQVHFLAVTRRLGSAKAIVVAVAD